MPKAGEAIALAIEASGAREQQRSDGSSEMKHQSLRLILGCIGMIVILSVLI